MGTIGQDQTFRNVVQFILESMSNSLNSLRDDLIASLHSDQTAASRISGRLGDHAFVRDLAEVCEPFDDYSNDPRMEAAYYLSLAPIGSLLPVASIFEGLLRLPLDGETMNSNISYHLILCLGRLVAEGGFSPSDGVAHLVEGA
ncbi:hypothetical protein QFZ42_004373 [Variovorax paradoxus]|uniref:hypothetical protein n=1 Tax=Variovorax paradoxus TaxID=34073 RepID=UPI00278F76E9|nr:hypothetical protein [Variovorax paradoxus]MDQ0572539.1 hypothetical protein [Variovorax paradoxus]